MKLNYKMLFWCMLFMTGALIYVADNTINEVVDLVNECRQENYNLKNPPTEGDNWKNQALLDFMQQVEDNKK